MVEKPDTCEGRTGLLECGRVGGGGGGTILEDVGEEKLRGFSGCQWEGERGVGGRAVILDRSPKQYLTVSSDFPWVLFLSTKFWMKKFNGTRFLQLLSGIVYPPWSEIRKWSKWICFENIFSCWVLTICCFHSNMPPFHEVNLQSEKCTFKISTGCFVRRLTKRQVMQAVMQPVDWRPADHSWTSF